MCIDLDVGKKSRRFEKLHLNVFLTRICSSIIKEIYYIMKIDYKKKNHSHSKTLMIQIELLIL